MMAAEAIKQFSICYRPQTWEEVYGQNITVRELRTRVLNNNFPKVTLFQGPYGTGKTTLAHIFAACMQASLPDGNPDWSYSSNKSILNETFTGDTVVLDGSQIGGKTDIVDFSRSLSFKPMKDKYKVVIIEEADQLTKQAENALLKVLENPDPYVRFILLSMEQNGISNAIKSRCQIYRIYPIGLKDMMMAMKSVMEKTGDWDNPDISDEFKTEGLKTIADASNGSLRTAFQYLDKCLSGRTYNIEDIKSILSTEDDKSAYSLYSELLYNPTAESVWLGLKSIVEPQGFLNYCIKLSQAAMLYKLSGVCFDDKFESSMKSQIQSSNLEILYDTVTKNPIAQKIGLKTQDLLCLMTDYLLKVKRNSTMDKSINNGVWLSPLRESAPPTIITTPVRRVRTAVQG